MNIDATIDKIIDDIEIFLYHKNLEKVNEILLSVKHNTEVIAPLLVYLFPLRNAIESYAHIREVVCADNPELAPFLSSYV